MGWTVCDWGWVGVWLLATQFLGAVKMLRVHPRRVHNDGRHALARHCSLLPQDACMSPPIHCSPKMAALGLYAGDPQNKRGIAHKDFSTVTILHPPAAMADRP